MTLALKYNPFAMATHNSVRWPRVLHHLLHVALGLPVWLLTRWVPLPFSFVLLLALGLSYLDKCYWIDTTRRRLVWTGFLAPGLLDGIADTGFTLLGATMPSPWLWIPLYYVLQLGSDP